MLLVIFPMFTFPKKLPPRHKKKKKKKLGTDEDDAASEDDVMKEKSNSKGQTVTSSMGFGKDIKGKSVSGGCTGEALGTEGPSDWRRISGALHAEASPEALVGREILR